MASAHFFYARHFLLLACFSILLALVTWLHLLIDLTICFTVYGALHAAAIVLTLRAHQSIWRKCLFVAIAAALSVIALRLGILGGHLVGMLAGNVVLYGVLGFSAVTGALTYGILIRLFGMYPMKPDLLAVTAVGCLLASYAALFTLTHSHYLGRWWLAVLWWYAFSGGLWYGDARRNTAAAAPATSQ